MLTFKDYLKDWRFYFKFFFGLFFFAVLVYDWIIPLIDGVELTEEQKLEAKNWEWFIQDKGDYTLSFLSFFHIQTNIMIALWLFFSAFFHDQEGKKESRWFNSYITLALTTYIIITSIIFNAFQLPNLINRTDFYFWFTIIVENIVAPIIMLFYYLFFMKKENNAVLSTKEYWHNYLVIYYVYPIVWLLFVLIRGEFRYDAGKVLAYQYFFINIHKTTNCFPGWFWFTIFVVSLSLLIFIISTLFNWISYKQQINKLNDKNKK